MPFSSKRGSGARGGSTCFDVSTIFVGPSKPQCPLVHLNTRLPETRGTPCRNHPLPPAQNRKKPCSMLTGSPCSGRRGRRFESSHSNQSNLRGLSRFAWLEMAAPAMAADSAERREFQIDHLTQRRQSERKRSPNTARRDIFVFMPVDISRRRHFTPCD